MNDLYSIITGLTMNAYSVAGFLFLISVPARMIIRAFRGKNPL